MLADEIYARYAYKEIIERDDKGAGCLPVFSFTITAQEVVDWAKTEPEENPSFNRGNPLTRKTACVLTIAELQDGELSAAPPMPIQKDLYAIFSSAAYVATGFGRTIKLEVLADGFGTDSAYFNSENFELAARIDFRQNAFEFIATGLDSLGIAPKKHLTTKIIVGIAAIPVAPSGMH